MNKILYSLSSFFVNKTQKESFEIIPNKLCIFLLILALLSISKYITLYLLSPIRYPTTIVFAKKAHL